MKHFDPLLTPEMFRPLFDQSSAELQMQWWLLGENARFLFDAGYELWDTRMLDYKLDILRGLEREGLLDAMLEKYIAVCRDREPAYLIGLGPAIVSFAKAGYTLRLPDWPFFGSLQSPGHVAALARVLEDDRLDHHQFDWLVLEVQRVHVAAEAWLKSHKNEPDHVE